MTDFSKILEKAKEIEKKMKDSQEAIKKIEVVGVSGGDLVKVKLNGDGEMINIDISEKLLLIKRYFFVCLNKYMIDNKFVKEMAIKRPAILKFNKPKIKINIGNVNENNNLDFAI